MSEIKGGCPWCGSVDLQWSLFKADINASLGLEFGTAIQCKKCRASGPEGYGNNFTEAQESAARKWESRGVTEKAEEPQRRPMDSISVTVDGEKVEIPCSDMGGSNNPDVAARPLQTSSFTNTDLAAAIDYAYTRAGKTDEGLKMQHHLEILLGIQRARAASATRGQ